MHLQSKYTRFVVTPLIICVTAMLVTVSAMALSTNNGKDKRSPQATQAPIAEVKKTKAKPHALSASQKKPELLK
jgi:hypothetical protein